VNIYIWLPILLLITIWYLTFSANRLDRLHHRAETSWANLDAILQRRAAVALEITHTGEVDPATSLLLTVAAHQAREAEIENRSEAESGLTQAIIILQNEAELKERFPDLFKELEEITDRLKFAIAIHVEAVNAARMRRSKWIYRVFRLAGHAPLPVKYAFEDDSLLEATR
jgi:hypothetical protein